MTPKNSPLFDDPKKNPTKSSYPNNVHLSDPPPPPKKKKKNEIQTFDPPKMVRAYVSMKISEYPLPSWERDLIQKGVIVLHDPLVCTIITGMQNSDEGLTSIILAVRGLLVEMTIAHVPYSIF